jgi:prepilin-type N-terminal cleavage/methylation domain-containing protein
MSSVHFMQPPGSAQRGFTLLELAFSMVVIGLLIAIGAYSVPWLNERLILDQTRHVMTESSDALLAFARTHHRLPCPDDNGDGLENCATASGTLPHLSLLLPAAVLDSAHRPIAYAVYRNSNATLSLDADLARLVNRIDDFDDLPNTLNVFDFCQALRNAVPAQSSAQFASTSTRITAGGGCAAGEVTNQAFVLASSGLEDRDGDGAPADEDNADANANCFSSPLRGRDEDHDDVVLAVSLATLLGEFCP